MLVRTKTGEPLITAAEAADFLRVDESDEQPLIELLLLAATDYCEAVTGRDVRPSEYRLTCDDFPGDSEAIVLELPGVASVSAIERRVSGVWTAFSGASNWYLHPSLRSTEIWLEDGVGWPSDADDRKGAVRIDFVTGDNPHLDICRGGILRHVAAMYADRGDDEAPRVEMNGFRWATTLAQDLGRSSGAAALYAPIALPSL